eukprot:GDKI01027747.1.p1 GENE.GDKI01027747.1~~GDKI01027747.1.p1  ORF type:complete len:382 (+),score=113.05 GDKI01027747.1:127-1146(+)
MSEKRSSSKSPSKTSSKRDSESAAASSSAGDGASSAAEKVVRVQKKLPEIGNKIRRQKEALKLLKERKKEKSKIRRDRQKKEQRGEEVHRQTPNTIELLRVRDDTIVQGGDVEVQGEDKADEFASYFDGSTKPKIMVTTNKRPSAKIFDLLKELVVVIPNTFYYKRGDFEIKKIVKYATNKGFTDLIVFNEKNKKPHGMWVTHLPEGPTSYYKITNVKLGQQMKHSATPSSHDPELILNNFDTRVGHRVARQLAALFPQKPEFRGRRVVAFHNQRDFIFFRHYRYVFAKEGEKCRLQEIGPRFTLKLKSLQQGTFDTSTGEYEYLWRPDLQVSRKTFFI